MKVGDIFYASPFGKDEIVYKMRVTKIISAKTVEVDREGTDIPPVDIVFHPCNKKKKRGGRKGGGY